MIVIKGSALLFTVFIALASFVALTEYCKMFFPGRHLVSIVYSASGAVIPFLFHLRSPAAALAALCLFFLIFSVWTLFSFKDIKDAAAEGAYFAFGALYIPFLMGYLVLLRDQPQGFKWILMMMLIVMSGDSAAYFVGSRFGKTKLYPEVSPKKSVEGSLGGLIGSAVGALLASFTFFPELAAIPAIIIALLAGFIGQVGDLFESMLKRSSGVKDSGSIFPGHGGILDRLDSILFAAPVTYYFALLTFGCFPG